MIDYSTSVTILTIDDWCAVYVDGKSVYQGHNVPLWTLKSVVSGIVRLENINESQYDYHPVLESWANATGRLPDTLGEVESIVNGY